MGYAPHCAVCGGPLYTVDDACPNCLPQGVKSPAPMTPTPASPAETVVREWFDIGSDYFAIYEDGTIAEHPADIEHNAAIRYLRAQLAEAKEQIVLLGVQLRSEQHRRREATASEASRAAMREALEPFAKRAAYFDKCLRANGGKWTEDEYYCDDPPSDIYLRDLFRARDILLSAGAQPGEGP